jgi:hypothetical protein
LFAGSKPTLTNRHPSSSSIYKYATQRSFPAGTAAALLRPMWEKSTALIKNYITGASKSRAIGAVCIGLAVGLVCNHLGMTGWKLHAIPILTMFGCYMLTAGHKW